MGETAPTVLRLRSGERTDHVRIVGTPRSATVTVEGGETLSLAATLEGDALTVTLDGLRAQYRVADSGHQIWLAGDAGVLLLEEVYEAPVRPDDEQGGDAELVSPMPGSVVAIGVSDGESLTAGTVVVTVEAMKMEHQLSAPVAGTVELLVAVGDQVKVGQTLARITVSTEESTHE
jgi:acetyl-CoA/propionyl-CoA carboxylase biotin carboxyl carrier protein